MTQPSPEQLLQSVIALHAKDNGEGIGGMTSGYCRECGALWPCPTWHIAQGLGIDAWHECSEQHWCSHIEEVMR